MKVGVVLVLAVAALYQGWRLFWFLTDDAFIQFRYVGNSLLGYGYVWNPPPFLPVEGYTSFLWVLILDGVWRATGISPPEAANGISLFFSALTVLLTAWMVLRMRLRPELEVWRVLFLGLVLAGVLANRTFLAWTSSGLETAMFNFWILLWLHGTLRLSVTRSPAHLLLVCSAAPMIALSRPDGLLYCASTLAIALAWGAGRWRTGELAPRQLLALLPLALVPAHVLWRRSFYGEWLPNTYFAKYTGAWPEAGWRYALSFTLEYALWVWVGLLLAVAPRLLSRGRSQESDRAEPSPVRAIRAVAVLTLVAHASYYTLIIGGDHFEYRVYSFLVPMMFLSFLWLLDRSGLRRLVSVGTLAAFVALSLPVPWIHWAESQTRTSREETRLLRVPVANSLPGPARWYGELFDAAQAWLIERLVCVRHQEHKAFWQYQLSRYPSREEGAALAAAGGRPVYATAAVGVPSWSLPRVAIIDRKGLNDYVIARAAWFVGEPRQMAHDRRPPPLYVPSFRPNVAEIESPPFVRIHRRRVELTERDIVEQERKWRSWVREWREDPRQSANPPVRNLVLIDLDNLLPDHLGLSGYPRPTSPHLDAFAEDGFVFAHVESSAPSTTEAVVSLMTSLLPDADGAREREATLAEILDQQGYSTGAFVECDRWKPGSGLERGFHVFFANAPGDRPNGSHLELALDWVGEHRAGPFFLYFHPGEPHPPWPPEDDLQGIRDSAGTRGPGAVAAYDAALARADEQVGDLLNAIEQLGLDASTMVVVVSDGGVDLGEPGKLDARLALFEQQLAAVLLMRVPEGFFSQPWCPGTMTSFARTIDVMPTALEALGIETRELEREGRSLFPEMSCGIPPDDRIFSLHPQHGLYAMRRGGIGLFLSTEDGATWLYDLEADPPRRLDDERPGLAARMESALRERIESP